MKSKPVENRTTLAYMLVGAERAGRKDEVVALAARIQASFDAEVWNANRLLFQRAEYELGS